MRYLVIGVLLASIGLIGCSKGSKRGSVPKGNPTNDNPNTGGNPSGPDDLGRSQAICKYRYEKSPQSEQWENLRPFKGTWISTRKELRERIDENGTVFYTKNGIGIESEIWFRPMQFIYSDIEGRNLIDIETSPAHTMFMSRKRHKGYFAVQTMHDNRIGKEKCSTFGIRLLQGENVLEVLGPILGDSLSDPAPITEFFIAEPDSEKFEIYEN